MKKILLGSLMGLFVVNQANAGLSEDINAQITANQTAVEAAIGDVSDNLLAVFAHRGLAPADTLGGGLFGVEIGVDASFVDFDYSKFQDIAGSNTDFDYNTVPLPKLSAAVGFPVIPLDLGVTYLPEVGGFSYLGAHAKYALLEGGAVMPAIALTGTYSKASMESAIDVETMGAELSISKGFGVGVKVIPYAGVGYLTGTTTLNSQAIPNDTNGDPLIKSEYDSNAMRTFVGASFQITLLNIVAEMDKTGDYQSASVKVGFRF